MAEQLVLDQRDEPAASPSLPLLDNVPAAPSWLINPAARATWNEVAPILLSNRMLTIGRTRAFADWCVFGAKISDAYLTNSAPSAALLTVHRRLANDLNLNALNVTVTAKANRFMNNAALRRK